MVRAASSYIIFFELLLIAVVVSPSFSYAQNPLDKKISISLEDINTEDALFKIAASGGFKLVYNSSIIPTEDQSNHQRDLSRSGL